MNRGYDKRRIEEARNFCNKLWNVARFIEDRLGDQPFTPKAESKTIADEWMLSKLQQYSREISALLDKYKFAEAYDRLYHLVWDEVADWYIEASKVVATPGMMAYTLETILKLAHVFALFY